MDSEIIKPASVIYFNLLQNDESARKLIYKTAGTLEWKMQLSVRIGDLPTQDMHLFITRYVLDSKGNPFIAQWETPVTANQENPRSLTLPDVFKWLGIAENGKGYRPGYQLVGKPEYVVYELALVSDDDYASSTGSRDLAAKIKVGTFFNSAIEVKQDER